MQIAIGDKVRFMNEVGGGRVTAILSKDMVSVETNDGFEIPTYIKNLVVVPPTLPSSQLSSSQRSIPCGRGRSRAKRTRRLRRRDRDRTGC